MNFDDITPLTFDDIARAVEDLEPATAPARILAHPDFVRQLLAQLPSADGPMLGGVPIKEVPGLHVRWMYVCDGKTVIESFKGDVLTYDTPVIDFTIPESPVMGSDFFTAATRPTRPPPRKRMGFYMALARVMGLSRSKRRRARRRSKGWRKHVRRLKAADRSGL